MAALQRHPLAKAVLRPVGAAQVVLADQRDVVAQAAYAGCRYPGVRRRNSSI